MVDDSQRHTSVAVLAHPLAVLCLAGWAVNDHVLKDRFHNSVTGKLSDAFAMVVFPLLLAVIFERFSRRPMMWAIAATTAFYSSINLFDFADRWTELALTRTIAHSRLTQDPTDLITLPLMAGAVWLWRNRVEIADRVPRAWGRALFAGGAVICMATSVSEPLSSPVVGTLVFDEDQTEVTMPVEFLLGGEPARPNLQVVLDITAFGEGPTDDGSRLEVVTWTNDEESMTISLTDPAWAPVQVDWEVRGFGIYGDACLLPLPTCESSVIPEVTIEAPPDQTIEAAVSLPMPSGQSGGYFVVESVVRIADIEAGAVARIGTNRDLLFTQDALIVKDTRASPIPLPEDCQDPCELSLWTTYMGTPPIFDLYGDVELIEQVEHVREPLSSRDETVTITEDDLGENGVNISFCATSNDEFEDELDRQIVGVQMTSTRTDQSDEEPQTRVGNFTQIDFAPECIARTSLTLRRDEGLSFPVEVTVNATIWQLPGDDPWDLGLTHEIVQR